LSASPDPDALVRSAVAALRAADAAGARRLFEEAIATGAPGGPAWLGVALACRTLGDTPGKLAALDEALRLNPHDLRALSMKGDHYAEAGDTRAAAAFYRALVNVAPPPDQLTPDLAREVARAQAAMGRYAAEFEDHLRRHLAEAGFSDPAASPRFARSLDILLGRKRLYLQEPRHYLFPELPQVQFYDRRFFPWLDALEARTEAIRAEALALLAMEGAFAPYVERAADRPVEDSRGMVGNPDWSAHFLWKAGEVVAANAARCPAAMAALAEAPLARVAGRTPSAMFSRLAPRTRIPPHTGFVNTRLICHLPLIVPPGCGLRVGNEAREMVQGRAWLFDDTIEHEAWNDSGEDRVILLFDVWRPELGEEERALVAALLEAVDTYGGRGDEWGA
jgi:aspartyl/asparaginyl beta-hydroxylase (cupin superfamily)